MAKQERLKETDLYPPVKTFLEGLGYEVKGEIAGADVVGLRGDGPPVIVELKTAFSLALFHQGIERLAISDDVYVAVPRGRGRAFHRSVRANRTLCRRLGLGLLLVDIEAGAVEPVIDPGPYAPRKVPRRKARLLKEFAARSGDPNAGGTAGRIVTAYRQDAIRCATFLKDGPAKGSEVAAATGVSRATRIMAADHYGWFTRVERGIYQLTEAGATALR